MDNKITKQRLSDFLSYDWVVMIIAILVGVFVCNFVFNLFAVRPTVGQTFRIIYDENVSIYNEDGIYDAIHNSFSYDVLKLEAEQMQTEYNVLDVRVQTHDADVVFTDTVKVTEERDVQVCRAWSIIDGFNVMDYRTLFNNANDYLLTFLKDVYKGSPNEKNAALRFEYLDVEKIDKNFEQRMLLDNRYRTEKKLNEGKLEERERIKQLCLNARKLQYLLDYHSEIFFKYTKYEQALARATAKGDSESIAQISEWIAAQKKNAPFGINLGKLEAEAGQKDISNFFKVKNADGAHDAVLLVFDMTDVQYDLQYESIGFTIALIEHCSGLLDIDLFN